MLKVLLTHTPWAFQRYYGDRPLAALRALAEVRLYERDQPLTAAGIIERGRDVDVILTDRNTPGPAEIFASLPELKVFMRCAMDVRTIDIAAASAAGVLVTMAPGGFDAACAELALGYMVDLSRGISRMAGIYHSGGTPEIHMGRQLAGSTVGILGYGFIGRYLARIAADLGMKVLVNDPYVRVEDPRFESVSFEDLLARSDYVVCLVVANPETENLMGATAFARMKPSAFFINISRGNLVDEAALKAALAQGLIAGAAIDVGRAPDQMPSPAVASLSNVIATSHIGALTPPSIERQAMYTVEQVEALVRREVPPYTVNAESWTRRIPRLARSTPCPTPSHA